MLTQSLSGPWLFRQVNLSDQLPDTHWEPGTVPGCVHTDLLVAARIPDPFVGTNEKDVKWVADQDWEYQREFHIDSELLSHERLDLVCEGLDTLAEISLNGKRVATTDNMFRQYRFDVKTLLHPGLNTLSIVFHSPVAYITKRQSERRLPANLNPGSAHLRKVPSHFGWDWGPVLPTSGIWRDIYLEAWSHARLCGVHLRQQHYGERVELSVTAECESSNPSIVIFDGEKPVGEELTLHLSLTAPDGMQFHASTPVDGDLAINPPSRDPAGYRQAEPSEVLPSSPIPPHQSTEKSTPPAHYTASLTQLVQNPIIWWPNGLGSQSLYQVEVTLNDREGLLDRRTFRIGLRKLELRLEDDEWGQSFTFVVNDVPIFAKGANWIPADAFVNRLTEANLEHFIQGAVMANFNMLRVWGGGYYESEQFYDLCDRYGILVWQEFIFACTPYPLDEPEFLENVRREVVDNVRRLRHRTCLAAWCGNNELEMMWGLWKRNESLTQAYASFFHLQLPEWIAADDPDHTYWPSSPSSGEFRNTARRTASTFTNSDARGDTHLWQVWHGLKPFTFYRTRFTRFASEFGLESLPSLETIASFASSQDYALNSIVFLHHQRSAGGNDKLIYYLTDRFRLPHDFSDLVYLTQILQAEAIRIGVEHWRRHRPRCMGALYWQYNDCWPVTSWSSVDYAGRWKALQHAARRFFAPVTLSIEDRYTSMGVFLVNDTQVGWQGGLRWSLETPAGHVIDSGQQPGMVDPLSSAHLITLDFSVQLRKQERRNLVFIAELWQAGLRVAYQVATFAPEKEMVFPDPVLSTLVDLQDGTLVIHLTAQAMARFVCLSLPGAEVIFSDNYFDLPAGRNIQVTCRLPAGWSLDQVKSTLSVRSLFDVKPATSLFRDRLQHLRIGLRPANLFSRLIFSLLK